FGQAGGGRSHHRTGGRVGQQLQGQRRTIHHFAPASLVAALLEPVAPVVLGIRQDLLELYGSLLGRRHRGGFGAAQRKVGPFIFAQGERRARAPLAVSLQRDGGEEPEQEVGAEEAHAVLDVGDREGIARVV